MKITLFYLPGLIPGVVGFELRDCGVAWLGGDDGPGVLAPQPMEMKGSV